MKLTFFFIFFILTAVGQNVKGVVLDKETLKPLENVNVYLNKDKTGTASNEKGEFNLKTISKINLTDSIRFSFIGYEPSNYTLSRLNELNFIVHLSKKIENLNEVTIVNNRKLKRTISYKKLSSLKKGVFNFGSTLIDCKLYVIGGNTSFIEYTAKKIFNEVSNTAGSTFEDLIKKFRTNFSRENYSDKLQIYDIEKDVWSISKLKFQKRAYHNIVFVNNYIYTFGGKTLSRNRKREYLDDKIEVLNLDTKQIIIDNTNPHQAVNFAAFPYQDNIIVIGGSIKQKNNGLKIYTDQSHIYNTTTGYWYELPKMISPKEVNGIIINNKIYLIGGFNKSPLSEIESYDILTGKWNSEGNLFHGIENPALTHSENIIYIYNDDKILTYNIETKILNEFRIDLNLKNSKIYYYKDKLYILGGLIEEEFKKSPSSRLYSIELNEFTNTEIINTRIN